MDYDQTERPPSIGIRVPCCLVFYLHVSQLCLGPTDVKVSILIRSMGPISDTDMVSCHQNFLNCLSDNPSQLALLYGLLFPPILEG